ncbi:Surface lipoprotein (modular protein) [Rhodospirillaceae bacterium LM-1]|nr:Surface lipoprotein (modular protein) [Rhodospirillaceae bacterium LM-1]
MGAFRPFLAACALTVLLAGCATPPPDSNKLALAEYKQTNDPGEPTNRAIFKANQWVDGGVIKPVAKGYGTYVPSPIRKSIRSFLTNMHEPWTFVNEVLQGEIKRSGVTLGRFCVNTTAGVLGLFDLMDEKLGPAHEEDFGQTLAVWGVGEGPFVTLPLLGPSNPRDAVGKVAGFVADPASLALALVVPPYGMAGIAVVDGIDTREKYIAPLDEVERTSLDYYASLRSMYRQKRAKDIGNGRAAAPQPIDYDLYETPSPAPVKPASSASGTTAPSAAAPIATMGDEQRQMDELVKQMRARVSGLKS